MHLDAWLADTPLAGGVAPKLGDAHLRAITVRGFPDATWPGLLDELNRLGFGYRWVTRFICLDKAEAERELTRLRRQWFAKRKSVVALLRETIFQQESPLVDSDATNQAADADAALQELGSDAVAFGYVTMPVVVSEPVEELVEAQRQAVDRLVQARGLVEGPETPNAVEAWQSSLPGRCYDYLRTTLVSPLTCAHLLPLSALWCGPE